MPGVTAPTRVKLQNILFATDFSLSAQAAFSHALHLARRYDAGVYSVHVLPHMPFVESAQPAVGEVRASAERDMTDLATSALFRGVRHTELIEEGEVSQVVSKLAQRYAIDLIVIGTGGRKKLEKLLLGSVAEEVFRNAECPVLTVGPHATRGEIDGNLQHILFATDFGRESLHGLPYAISLAEENRAHLTLLHVAPEPGVPLAEVHPGTLPLYDKEELIASAESRLRGLMLEKHELCHEPEYAVQFGAPADTIVKTAAAADVIVLGVKRPTPFTKHLGAGVAYQVVCDAPCPVLSVGARHHAQG